MWTRSSLLFAGCVGALSAAASAEMIEVTVTIENLAPQFGTWQTPFWVGFHNGAFDLYDSGAAASSSLERLAEDGDVSFVSADFLASGLGALDGAIAPGGPYAPGAIASMSFMLDSTDPEAAYFSFASMVIPSNDAFVGNDDPLAFQIFNAGGGFLGADFFITGAHVLDAGTEVNDEIPENTAFFGQTVPNTGVTEGGVVGSHPGYIGSFGNPGGTPSILADPMFAGADFTLPGYPIARITVVPGPSATALLAVAGLVFARRRRG